MWENAYTLDFMESFKDFPQKCSNDDVGLTLTFLMARSNLLSRLSYGKSLWNL